MTPDMARAVAMAEEERDAANARAEFLRKQLIEKTQKVADLRTTTIRLPEDMAEEVKQAARADGITVSALVRAAVQQHIERRMATTDFRARLAASIARDQARLAALEARATST